MLSNMSRITSRLISRAIEQIAGSGVGIDESGRLYFPDGLDSVRVHRFIELVMEQQYRSPKAAMKALFARVGVPAPAIEALDKVLNEDASLAISAIGRHPLELSAALPSVREIPVHFRRFLVEGLGLAHASDATLEQAAVSTRKQAAREIGCETNWDAILDRGDEVGALAQRWRDQTGI
jgi:hypothetical protein